MRRTLTILLLFLSTLSFSFAENKGYWEIGVHYSTWNIDAIAPILEDNIVPDLEYYNPEKGDLNFDSNGNNYGIELRFFPGGKYGSFSIGLSYELNNFKGTATGTYSEVDEFGNRIDASADGSMDLTPHSVNLGLRWELWPTARVHPYIGFAIGFGAMNGILQFHSIEKKYIGGVTQIKETNQQWTLKEAIDEVEGENNENTYPVGFFPIIHVQFGLRGEITENIYLLAEAALYDGFILRGGIAFRF